MKYLFAVCLAFALSIPASSQAQEALYNKAEYTKILESYDEVIVVMQGFDYKYAGSWLNTMEIVGDHTLTFSRGKVSHSFDLSRTMFLQEEGNWVKIWLI